MTIQTRTNKIAPIVTSYTTEDASDDVSGFLPEISWEDDYHERMNPQLMTDLLHEAVPVLRATNWRIDQIDEGECVTVLPLNEATTNQHGTHQAALISLSADYTGGVAFASLLKGVKISGVHPVNGKCSVSLWLAAMDVKYISPSTGHLIARCTVAEEIKRKIIARYSRGKRVLVSLPITFESNGEVVAKADMKYFAQPTDQLSESASSALFENKLKASARMIAGVRASGTVRLGVQDRKAIDGPGSFERIDRPCDRAAAGPHGLLLANKLQRALPQLSAMVNARTEHIDETLRSILDLRQVVLVGAGLDMRPFRLAGALAKVKYFELDLPEMLAERSRVIAAGIPGNVNCRRVSLAADFRTDEIDRLLLENEHFDPELPTAFVYEGCSMYFDESANVSILKRIATLMQNPGSRLWADFVSHRAIEGTSGAVEVDSFLTRMSNMGEAFVFGLDNPHHLLSKCGLTATLLESSLEFLGVHDQPDAPIYDLYGFTISKAQTFS